MSFRERERARLVAVRQALFADAGGGVYQRAPRDFVLADAKLNLWPAIRDEAPAYFKTNKIQWWDGKTEDDLPSGHLLSSQIACVNHLFPLRFNEEAVTAILRMLDADVVKAELIDDGYVAFEFIGERPYLKEKRFSRGANCTSVDAAIIGRLTTGERRLFLVEWKYTELYAREDKYIDKRSSVYDHLIVAVDGPFKSISPRALYFEPFYQLMRQTLLAHELVRNGDHDCSSYLHVHVAPKHNSDFHDNVTARDLVGDTVNTAWTGILKEPERFRSVTPEHLLAPIAQSAPPQWLDYLQQRYWAGV